VTVPTAAAATRFAAPQSYTPKHLAEKILTSKSALEGERKQVTVLFADLKGSMELLADRDPEEARKLLDPVLERMMEAIHRYEGTVNQVMGDGIMALFGAPLAHEDHAVRACYAALRMQRRVTLYADEIQRGGGTPVQIRVGLNSGEVVVRAIGSDLHMDYTAVGQTTHLAARMEQMAKPGSALVTGETLKLAEGYVQAKPLGAVAVKGLEIPTPVYELTGTVPTRSRLQASAARGLTRFVGRDSELQQLTQALERAAAGHGQAVAVLGEAGVGKSRLVWEFTRSHRTHGWLVLESGSVSYGKATPYLPVIELLKAYCRIQERDDPRAIRERMAGKLLMLDRALEPLLTPLLALLDVPVDEAPWATLDPPQRRQRTLEAVKRLLLRESQVQPLLVIFEDLHWIDAETQALLDGLMESLPTARVLLLVTYRPEYQHTWGRKSYYLQLRIDPLPPKSAEALLTAVLGEDRTLGPLKRVLIERTEGNPFFLEESVQTLVETQVLVGERGAYRTAKAPDAWQIPATVQAMLAARIDRLASEDKRLLQTAAVIGKDVPFALLQAIADEPEDSLRRGLTHLQGAEFLYEASLFPDLEYTFKHALTHEIGYGAVLQDRRRVLHARIMKAIEGLYPERLTELVERLAHHALRGEAWEQALAYAWQAGSKAMTRSANREAVACFEQALTALRHLPESRERVEQAIDLRFELRYALSPIGEWDRALAYVEKARPLAEALGDQRRLGWVLANIATPLSVRGEHERAAEAAEGALAIAGSLKDFRLQVEAMFYGADIHGLLGDYRRAVRLLREAVEALVGEWLHWGTPGISSVLCRAWLGRYLAVLGEFPEAIERTDEGIRIAEEAGQPYSRVHVHLAAGEVHLSRGNIAQAIARLEQGLHLAEDWNLAGLRRWGAPLASLAYARAGRVDEAVSLAGQVAEWINAIPLGLASLLIHPLGETYLVAGRLADAAPLAERALTVARDLKEPGHEALVLHLLGDIAAQREPPELEAADGYYRRAAALADKLGMRPLVAHCHLGLGKLYRRTGDPAKADEHLTTATTMYREMGMGFWLDKSEAEHSAGGR
jgi:class 3 adenylate cyclase/tetratricopeptide (TPR) repeat protein